MSRILNEIMHAYPSLAIELSSLPADESSDSRLMAELATHVVDLVEAGHCEEIRPAFELAEHLIAAGPGGERGAAVLGFLETVQNVASHRKCGMAAFEQFLGPGSQCAWEELIEAWRGKMSLAEVVASETGARLRPRWWEFWRKRDRRTPSELLSQVQNPELRKIIEQITRE
ncbi:MAG TPA: hypothetical protein VGE83_03745 [Terracidiphilus sp.]|jgi:hypothetical protein